MNTVILAVTVLAALLTIRHLYFWSPLEKSRHYDSRPVFFAHRGLLHLAPENTKESLSKAIDMGFTAVEYDVVSTKDDVVICSHNFDLERKTNAIGWVADKTWDEIKHTTTGGLALSRLEEVLETLPDTILHNIEIKTSKIFDLKTAKLVSSLIKQRGIENRVIISSFNPFTIGMVKLVSPQIRTGFILETMDFFFMFNWVHPDYLHPSIDLANENLIKFAKDRNLGINVWTVNNKPAIQWLLNKNVDGIITDKHELHLERTNYNLSSYGPQLERIPFTTTRNIRHSVLRKGFPYHTTLWDKDRDVDTIHLGLTKNGKTLSIVSFMKNNSKYLVGRKTVQLRGMATIEGEQNKGYGSDLLTKSLEFIKENKLGDVVWANIRVSAIEFYTKHGFDIMDDEFITHGIGPHRTGIKELN